jgi:GNAT superfamily N-acetyltransferase
MGAFWSLSIMLTIRPAAAQDATLIKDLIYELAEFERERHIVTITETDLLRDGFGVEPKFRVLIAEWSGQAAGYALFYGSYSTWEGRPGLFLEDLFVRPPYRSLGIGRALLTQVARIAQTEQCYGVRWEVLHWNQAAIEFYQGLGATFVDQWKSMVLTGKALERAANPTA